MSQTPVRPTRRRPRPRPKLADIPLAIRFGLPLAVVALLAWQAFRAWRASVTTIAVVTSEGAPLPGAGLAEFFAYTTARVAPSPPPKLGEVDFDGAFQVGSRLVPGQALVRLTVPGQGIGFLLVSRGEATRCPLGAPEPVQGVVLAPDGTPAAGARVLALGGGPYGVLLAEARTPADGRFEIGGVSKTAGYVHLRVLQDGCAVAAVDAWLGQTDVEVRLQATQPVPGSVATRGLALPAAGHRVCALVRVTAGDSNHDVPGIEATTDASGAFVLHHLPPAPARTRLAVATLPEGYTHEATWVEPGDPAVEIAVFPSGVVSGRVVDVATGLAAVGAAVMHEHGPRGGEVAYCDEAGRFVIGAVPPGQVTLEVVHQRPVPGPAGRPRMRVLSGTRVVAMSEGGEVEDVTIQVH